MPFHKNLLSYYSLEILLKNKWVSFCTFKPSKLSLNEFMDAQLDILPIHFYYFSSVNVQLAQKWVSTPSYKNHRQFWKMNKCATKLHFEILCRNQIWILMNHMMMIQWTTKFKNHHVIFHCLSCDRIRLTKSICHTCPFVIKGKKVM